MRVTTHKVIAVALALVGGYLVFNLGAINETPEPIIIKQTEAVIVYRELRQPEAELSRDFTAYNDWALREYLEFAAPAFGMQVDTARKIIWCESGGKWWVKNAEGSSATGLFQITKGTWATTPQSSYGTRTNPYDNINAALYLMVRDGLGHWNASKDCWQD